MAEEYRVSRRGDLLAASSKGAVIAVVVLAAMSGAIPGQSKTDCAEVYNNYLESLKGKRLSPERRAALRRWALRAYDACDTGDLEHPNALFERLEREGY